MVKPPTEAIKQLQAYVTAKIKERGFSDETLQERLLLLVEEVGELVKAGRKVSGMNVDQDREIIHEAGEELADVLNLLFAVAAELNIDVASELEKKEAIIDQRKYKRKS